jgi:hypothetical protein
MQQFPRPSRDRFTVTTRQNWFSRVANSFVGMLFGVVLVPLAIAGLWWNEGVPDLSKIADDSLEISSASVDPSMNGKFVSITGPITSESSVSDPPFIESGAYVALTRRTEIYAWYEERRSSETVDAVGGGSTTETTYTYDAKWVTTPDDSTAFEYPEEHRNPAKTLSDATFAVDMASIGAYTIDVTQGVELPSGATITPPRGELPAGYGVAGTYIYTRSNAQSAPRVGDERLSYTALASGTTVTAFGSVKGGIFAPYRHSEHTFFEVMQGTRSEALEALHASYVLFVWIIRVVGVVCIFAGLQLLTGPISRLLSLIGIVGAVFDGISGFFNAVLALLIGVTTIIISMIFHNIILMIILLVALVGFAVWYLRSRSAAAAQGA